MRARLFFFFQAEDGIRDWSVTGVQTCALPISRASAGRQGRSAKRRLHARDRALRADGGRPPAEGCRERLRALASNRDGRLARTVVLLSGISAARSEERRVGEERRSGWVAVG